MSPAAKVLAIVPARGGSKGIPQKNLYPLGGKPLIAYTLEQAREAPTVSRLVVSTDSAEIASAARQFGAEVVWRPAELSDDTASSESALLHVLRHLQEAEGYSPQLIVFLQATSPLRSPGLIDSAVTKLQDEEADSLFSACRLRGFVWRDAQNGVEPVDYDPLHRPRRQERGTEWVENGSIYVFKPWVLFNLGSRVGGKTAVLEMDLFESVEIDEPEDVRRVEFLMAHYLSSGRGWNRLEGE